MRIGVTLGICMLGACLALAACSDDEEGGGTGAAGGTGGAAGTGGSSGAGGASGAGGTGGTGGAGGTAASGGSSGAAGTAGASGAAGAGGAAGSDAGLDAGKNGFAEIQSMDFTVECATDAGADQVSGEFDVEYTNGQSSGDLFATLSSVELVFEQNLSALKWTFKPSPAASGNISAGQTVSVKHINVIGTGSGSGDPCGFCNGTVQLSVDWALDGDAGVTVSDTFGPVPVKCNP